MGMERIGAGQLKRVRRPRTGRLTQAYEGNRERLTVFSRMRFGLGLLLGRVDGILVLFKLVSKVSDLLLQIFTRLALVCEELIASFLQLIPDRGSACLVGIG